MLRPDIPFLTAEELRTRFSRPIFRVDKDGDLTWRWRDLSAGWPRRTLYLEYLVARREFKAGEYLRSSSASKLHWSNLLTDDGRCESLVEVLRAALSPRHIANCIRESLFSK